MDKGTFPHYVIIGDLMNLVLLGQKELWRPLAANRSSCDFKKGCGLRPQLVFTDAYTIYTHII